MKQLNPDGSITIPSNLPRTRRGPDSRGIRICFSEIGRSCALKTGYLTFTDGSAYEYAAPGNTDVEQLCAALQRGRMFNFSVRRSRGGFTRGFIPPGDYQIIYSFPPYAGTQPIDCADIKPDWTMTGWSVTTAAPQAGQTITFSLDPGTGDTEVASFSGVGHTFSGNWTYEGDLSFTGPATNCQLDYVITSAGANTFWNVQVDVYQDGVNILTQNFFGTGSVSNSFPFTVADTAGAASALQIVITIVAGTFATSSASFSVQVSNV
jgi:hypothetical protein